MTTQTRSPSADESRPDTTGGRPVLVAGLPWWHAVGLALVVALVALRAWAFSRGYFWQDDFVYLSRAAEGLDLDYLVQDYHGHLMPGQFLLVWMVQTLSPMSWTLAAAVVLVLQALAGLAVLRLLRTLTGDRPVLLVPFALWVFSPLLLTATGWWAAALQTVPLQLAMALAWDHWVRWLRLGRRRDLVVTCAAFGGGLVMWEKALLVLPLLVGAAWLDGHLTSATWRRTLTGLVPAAVLAAAYAVVYVLRTGAPARGPLAGDEVVQLVRVAVLETLVPGLFGGTWGTAAAGATLTPEPPRPVMWLSWQLLLGLVILTVVARGRGAVRAWTVAGGYIALDLALVAYARLDFVGPVIGRDPRYVADAVLVVAGCLAVALTAPSTGAFGDRLDRIVDRPLVVVGTCVLLLNAGLLAASGVIERLPSQDAREFVTTAREAAETPGGVDLVDGPVPDYVISPIFRDDARASVALGPLPVPPRFGGPSPDLRMVDGFGHPRPLEVLPAATSRAGPLGDCGWAVRTGGRAVPLDRPVPDGTWVVQVGYYARSDTSGELSAAGHTTRASFPAGLGEVLWQVSGSLTRVELADLDTGTQLCVTDVSVGTPWPVEPPAQAAATAK